MNKTNILTNICYTELVYQRINKKLGTDLSKLKIEKMIFEMIKKTPESSFLRRGKNFYISNRDDNITVTINSNTYRVITVDLIE